MANRGRRIRHEAASAVAMIATLAMISSLGGTGESRGSQARISSLFPGNEIFAVQSLPGDALIGTGADRTDRNVMYLTPINGSAAAGTTAGTTAARTSAETPTVRRIPTEGGEALPWTITVTYSLDGPEVSASDINNASGLVGIHIAVQPNDFASAQAQESAASLTPMIAFTIPTKVASEINANDGTIVAQQGSDTLIAAVGRSLNSRSGDSGGGADGNSGGDSGSESDSRSANQTERQSDNVLTVDAYVSAKQFAISDIAFAAVPATNAADYESAISELAARASGLADATTGVANPRNATLINQLTALRDRERELATTTIAQRTAAHKRAFDAYMAAYVGSYTTHLSGSIGQSTQMTALMGTAGELSGDTPLAAAVGDLANAVNMVSAAHRHTGAADMLDEIIRMIRQRGTQGLAAELKTRAGEESVEGNTGFSDGQGQLSRAMIPYSMAYTDVYTSHLSELTGGTTAGASAFQQQAIDATNDDFASRSDLKGDTAQVDAAMATLATASEHTGRAQAIDALLLRFSDEFAAGDDGGDGGGDGGDAGGAATASGASGAGGVGAAFEGGIGAVRVPSIAATVEQRRQAEYRSARSKEAARQRKDQQSGKLTSLVDDTSSIDMKDVMSYAGGIGGAGGGSGSTGDGSSADSQSGGHGSAGGSSGGSAGDSAGSSADGAGSSASADADSSDSASLTLQPSLVYGVYGFDSRSLLTPDAGAQVDETVTISSAADTLGAAVKALRDADALNGALDLSKRSSGTSSTERRPSPAAESRFLIVVDAL